MFEAFKNFLSDVVEGDKHPSRFAENDYRLAAAAMLVHAAAIDGNVSDVERNKLHAVIKRHFGLDDATTDELVTEATQAEHEAIDLYHFTRLINRSLDEDGRKRLVEMMWEIAYADGHVTEFEDNLLWRAADLLGISAHDRIELRHRVASRRGTDGAVSEAKRPVTLITGASAGIGSALARVFAANGHELDAGGAPRRPASGAGRRDRRPRSAAAAGRGASICRRATRSGRSTRRSRGQGVEPEIVVNNAGFGLLGPAASLDRAEQLAMIDLNVRALTELSLAWIDSLKRRKGGILNVGSVAGFLPGPGMAVYYATKAYVLSFSQALHQELKPLGVRVTVLCPGPGADRIPGARRREQHDLSAPPGTLGRTGGRRRLSRAQGRTAPWSFRAAPTRW